MKILTYAPLERTNMKKPFPKPDAVVQVIKIEVQIFLLGIGQTAHKCSDGGLSPCPVVYLDVLYMTCL